MAVADLEATPFAPAVLAHDLSLIHVHAQCHTQATRDILEAAAGPDQSVGLGGVVAAMTLGTVDLDLPKPGDMAKHCMSFPLLFMWYILSVYSKSKYLQCKQLVCYPTI